MGLRTPAAITVPEVRERGITVAKQVFKRITANHEGVLTKEAFGFITNLFRHQGQGIAHHRISDLLWIQHIDVLILAGSRFVIPHRVHTGHSIQVHTMGQFFLSLPTHPLTQHQCKVGRGIESLQLSWVNAALKSNNRTILSKDRSQRFLGSVGVQILCQAFYGGLLGNSTCSGETNCKPSTHIHTARGQASILENALVVRSLTTDRGEVVPHAGTLEDSRAGVVSNSGITLALHLSHVLVVLHHQRSTFRTNGRNVTLHSIEPGSTLSTCLVSFTLSLEHTQNLLHCFWFLLVQFHNSIEVVLGSLIQGIQGNQAINLRHEGLGFLYLTRTEITNTVMNDMSHCISISQQCRTGFTRNHVVR